MFQFLVGLDISSVFGQAGLRTMEGRTCCLRWVCDYSEAFRSRSAFAITETELKLIAALASMGLRSQ
jgi:hypothetical protein